MPFDKNTTTLLATQQGATLKYVRPKGGDSTAFAAAVVVAPSVAQHALATTAPTTAGSDGRAVDGNSHSSVAATGAEERDSSSKGVKGDEWAKHQVEHALDYAVDSAFWLHISNGLNLQVLAGLPSRPPLQLATRCSNNMSIRVN